jgi:hypothetical protein
MPTEPEITTLAQVVHRAVEVADPAGESAGVEALLRWFEDRDEPVPTLEDIDAHLVEATTAIDPEGDEPALAMAAAVASYLAHRRDEVADDRESLLRLAARAEYDDHPPPAVADWLGAQGV